MLHKHREACRFPHGHTRRIEVVVASETLDANDMVVDFKALKLALGEAINRFDHRMAIHRDDPLREAMAAVHPDSLIVFDRDPTTEVIAEELFRQAAEVLAQGFSGASANGHVYEIPAGRLRLERLRVWETPNSWAEFSVS
ncbi:MAG: 6-carboxytetrahydropterin synthase [Chthonomonas sp.]|nr:6-carboxytetrahydropterin synthase [Chthonomonas sp.]